jgi:SnoaL-like domain
MPDGQTLADRAAAHGVIASYFALCDQPQRAVMRDFRSLFTADAVWEGLGARYASRHGRIASGDAIAAALNKALAGDGAYRFNLHQLSTELWDNDIPGLAGSWLMTQHAALTNGETYCAVADIRVRFAKEGGTWRIARFSTRNLMMLPVPGGLGDDPDLAGLDSLA